MLSFFAHNLLQQLMHGHMYSCSSKAVVTAAIDSCHHLQQSCGFLIATTLA